MFNLTIDNVSTGIWGPISGDETEDQSALMSRSVFSWGRKKTIADNYTALATSPDKVLQEMLDGGTAFFTYNQFWWALGNRIQELTDAQWNKLWLLFRDVSELRYDVVSRLSVKLHGGAQSRQLKLKTGTSFSAPSSAVQCVETNMDTALQVLCDKLQSGGDFAFSFLSRFPEVARELPTHVLKEMVLKDPRVADLALTDSMLRRKLVSEFQSADMVTLVGNLTSRSGKGSDGDVVQQCFSGLVDEVLTDSEYARLFSDSLGDLMTAPKHFQGLVELAFKLMLAGRTSFTGFVKTLGKNPQAGALFAKGIGKMVLDIEMGLIAVRSKKATHKMLDALLSVKVTKADGSRVKLIRELRSNFTASLRVIPPDVVSLWAQFSDPYLRGKLNLGAVEIKNLLCTVGVEARPKFDLVAALDPHLCAVVSKSRIVLTNYPYLSARSNIREVLRRIKDRTGTVAFRSAMIIACDSKLWKDVMLRKGLFETEKHYRVRLIAFAKFSPVFAARIQCDVARPSFEDVVAKMRKGGHISSEVVQLVDALVPVPVSPLPQPSSVHVVGMGRGDGTPSISAQPAGSLSSQSPSVPVDMGDSSRRGETFSISAQPAGSLSSQPPSVPVDMEGGSSSRRGDISSISAQPAGSLSSQSPSVPVDMEGGSSRRGETSSISAQPAGSLSSPPSSVPVDIGDSRRDETSAQPAGSLSSSLPPLSPLVDVGVGLIGEGMTRPVSTVVERSDTTVQVLGRLGAAAAVEEKGGAQPKIVVPERSTSEPTLTGERSPTGGGSGRSSPSSAPSSSSADLRSEADLRFEADLRKLESADKKWVSQMIGFWHSKPLQFWQEVMRRPTLVAKIEACDFIKVLVNKTEGFLRDVFRACDNLEFMRELVHEGTNGKDKDEFNKVMRATAIPRVKELLASPPPSAATP